MKIMKHNKRKEEKSVVTYNHIITCPIEYWEQFKTKSSN